MKKQIAPGGSVNRRGFLLALVAAPAAPLAAKWTRPQPNYGAALAASMLQTKWVRQATMHNPAFSAPFGGTLHENLIQSRARDVYREFMRTHPGMWVVE